MIQVNKSFKSINTKFKPDRLDEEFFEIMSKNSSELTDFRKEMRIIEDKKFDITIQRRITGSDMWIKLNSFIHNVDSKKVENEMMRFQQMINEFTKEMNDKQQYLKLEVVDEEKCIVYLRLKLPYIKIEFDTFIQFTEEKIGEDEWMSKFESIQYNDFRPIEGTNRIKIKRISILKKVKDDIWRVDDVRNA